MTEPQWVAPGSDPVSRPIERPPAYAAPTAPLLGVDLRPGIIPLRPLSLGDVYSGVVKAVRGNVAATVGLAFVTSLAFLVPMTALGTWVAATATPDGASAIGTNLPGFGTVLSSVPLTGFLAFVVGQAVLGRRVSASQTWQGTRRFILRLVGATALTAFVTFAAAAVILVAPILGLVNALQSDGGSSIGGPVALVVLASLVALPLVLFLTTRLAFAPAAIVLEQTGVITGVKRSWRLTSGTQFWRVLGIRILSAVVAWLARQILTVPLAVLGGAALVFTGDLSKVEVWQTLTSGVAALIAGSLTTPFSAGVDALLYVDQRIRREGLDVQLIAAAQAETRAPAGPSQDYSRPGPV